MIIDIELLIIQEYKFLCIEQLSAKISFHIRLCQHWVSKSELCAWYTQMLSTTHVCEWHTSVSGIFTTYNCHWENQRTCIYHFEHKISILSNVIYDPNKINYIQVHYSEQHQSQKKQTLVI